MISRRTLLGTLVGLPLAAKAALGMSPKSGDSPITHQPTFSQRRIEDIVQAGALYVREFLHGKGIQPQLADDDRLLGGPHGYAFLLPHEDHIQNMDFILESFFRPGAHCLEEALHKNNRSKCRFIHIDVRPHPEGLNLWVGVTQQEKPRYSNVCLYERWLRV